VAYTHETKKKALGKQQLPSYGPPAFTILGVVSVSTLKCDMGI